MRDWLKAFGIVVAAWLWVWLVYCATEGWWR